MKKKKAKTSATQMSLKKLRGEGYLCEIVEKTIPVCFIKKDLFGFIDLLCIRGSEVLAVQTTTGDNSSKRVKKILEHENYPLVKALGWEIVVHGWRPLLEKCKNGNKKKVWSCKEIIL
jgi:hypothetical protein